MIQTQTLVKVADNSGAKKARCIKVLGGFNRRYARLGDIIIVSIKSLRNKHKESSKVKKGEVYKGIVIRTKSRVCRKDGLTYCFNENSVALLTKNGKPIATRVFGAVPRNINFSKINKISQGYV